jgi:hypothetical protein
MPADPPDEPVDITPFLIPEEGQRRLDAYYLALGKFVTQFAGVEAGLSNVLRHYTRTTVAISRAVFSGARIDTALGFLNRLSEIEAI